VLRVFSDLSLSADSEFVDVATYVEACAAQLRLESAIMVVSFACLFLLVMLFFGGVESGG
jgi:hypothetical protein